MTNGSCRRPHLQLMGSSSLAADVIQPSGFHRENLAGRLDVATDVKDPGKPREKDPQAGSVAGAQENSNSLLSQRPFCIIYSPHHSFEASLSVCVCARACARAGTLQPELL